MIWYGRTNFARQFCRAAEQNTTAALKFFVSFYVGILTKSPILLYRPDLTQRKMACLCITASTISHIIAYPFRNT